MNRTTRRDPPNLKPLFLVEKICGPSPPAAKAQNPPPKSKKPARPKPPFRVPQAVVLPASKKRLSMDAAAAAGSNRLDSRKPPVPKLSKIVKKQAVSKSPGPAPGSWRKPTAPSSIPRPTPKTANVHANPPPKLKRPTTHPAVVIKAVPRTLIPRSKPPSPLPSPKKHQGRREFWLETPCTPREDGEEEELQMGGRIRSESSPTPKGVARRRAVARKEEDDAIRSWSSIDLPPSPVSLNDVALDSDSVTAPSLPSNLVGEAVKMEKHRVVSQDRQRQPSPLTVSLTAQPQTETAIVKVERDSGNTPNTRATTPTIRPPPPPPFFPTLTTHDNRRSSLPTKFPIENELAIAFRKRAARQSLRVQSAEEIALSFLRLETYIPPLPEGFVASANPDIQKEVEALRSKRKVRG